MAKKVYEESKIKAIADAIREKTGGYETYTTSQMLNGVSAVYKAGLNDEHSLCWDAIQREGTRHDYGWLSYQWKSDWFYPKYDIVLGDTNPMGEILGIGTFRQFNKDGDANFDLSERLEECGVKLDTSKCQVLQYFMHTIKAKRVPTLDFSSATNLYMTFYYTDVQIIDKLVSSEITNFVANTFQYNNKLTTITEVEGVIAKSINFQHSPLDVPTMNRIIEHLKVQSSGTYTLTLKADRQNLLSNEMKTLATNKGWTLVWS
jgi:hypothetical protein